MSMTGCQLHWVFTLSQMFSCIFTTLKRENFRRIFTIYQIVSSFLNFFEIIFSVWYLLDKSDTPSKKYLTQISILSYYQIKHFIEAFIRNISPSHHSESSYYSYMVIINQSINQSIISCYIKDTIKHAFL